MQLAFDHVPEDILVADSNKCFRYANQAACQSLGYTKKELENLRIPDIAPNHENQRYQEHLKKLGEGKTCPTTPSTKLNKGKSFP